VSSRETVMKNRPSSPGGQYPQVFEKTIAKTVKCRYLLYLPNGYGKKQQQWPLIIFLHGIGERGSDLEKVKMVGLPKLVEEGMDFQFVIVSPQCPANEWWSSEVLAGLLDDVILRYAVDAERIYLTGLSMGGFGTWYLSCAYPERFAAIAPICGGGEPAFANRLKDVGVWAFHGAKDDVVPVKRSQEMVDAVKACGGDARLTIYPDAGHDSWTQTYNNKQLYDWFLEHHKNR